MVKSFASRIFLAGDHKYIFLFANDRYVIFHKNGENKTFDFVLNAELLVTEHNALVGGDLLDEYRELFNECATFSIQQKPALRNVDCSRCARRCGRRIWSC